MERFIRVSGSNKVMGKQQGEAFEHELKRALKVLMDFEGFKYLKPPLLSPAAFLEILLKGATTLLARTIKKEFPELHNRMIGIAKGAGISKEVLYLVAGIELIMPSPSCTTIVLTSERTKFAEPVLLKNYDMFEEFARFNLLRESIPLKGFTSFEFTKSILAGAHLGINQAGLVVSYNYGLINIVPQPAPPTTLLVQYLLQNCSSVSEAIEFIRKAKHGSGAILTLLDATGEAAAVEITPHAVGIRPLQDGAIVSANRFLTEEVAQYNVSPEARYQRPAPSYMWGHPIQASSEAREQRVWELLSKTKKFDLKNLFEILKDHGPDKRPSDLTVCRHFNRMRTTASAVILPKSREIYYTWGNPCMGEYKHLKLFKGA